MREPGILGHVSNTTVEATSVRALPRAALGQSITTGPFLALGTTRATHGVIVPRARISTVDRLTPDLLYRCQIDVLGLSVDER